MVQRREDERDDHENKWAKCTAGIHVDLGARLAISRCLRGPPLAIAKRPMRQTSAMYSPTKTCCKARGYSALGVDIHVVDVEHVVAVGTVEEVQADSCEEQNKRCDSSVTDRDNLDVISNEK